MTKKYASIPPRCGKTATMELLKKIQGKGYSYYENHQYENSIPKKPITLNCSDAVEDYMNEQELIHLHNTMAEHMKDNGLTEYQKRIGEQKMAEIRERIIQKGIERNK